MDTLISLSEDTVENIVVGQSRKYIQAKPTTSGELDSKENIEEPKNLNNIVDSPFDKEVSHPSDTSHQKSPQNGGVVGKLIELDTSGSDKSDISNVSKDDFGSPTKNTSNGTTKTNSKYSNSNICSLLMNISKSPVIKKRPSSLDQLARSNKMMKNVMNSSIDIFSARSKPSEYNKETQAMALENQDDDTISNTSECALVSDVASIDIDQSTDQPIDKQCHKTISMRPTMPVVIEEETINHRKNSATPCSTGSTGNDHLASLLASVKEAIKNHENPSKAKAMWTNFVSTLQLPSSPNKRPETPRTPIIRQGTFNLEDPELLDSLPMNSKSLSSTEGSPSPAMKVSNVVEQLGQMDLQQQFSVLQHLNQLIVPNATSVVNSATGSVGANGYIVLMNAPSDQKSNKVPSPSGDDKLCSNTKPRSFRSQSLNLHQKPTSVTTALAAKAAALARRATIYGRPQTTSAGTSGKALPKINPIDSSQLLKPRVSATKSDRTSVVPMRAVHPLKNGVTIKSEPSDDVVSASESNPAVANTAERRPSTLQRQSISGIHGTPRPKPAPALAVPATFHRRSMSEGKYATPTRPSVSNSSHRTNPPSNRTSNAAKISKENK